jgi:hypothetical protein
MSDAQPTPRPSFEPDPSAVGGCGADPLL